MTMFIITTAPDVYDYGYTTEISGAVTSAQLSDDFVALFGAERLDDTRYLLGLPRPMPMRLVMTPEASDGAYQLGRYQSGAYMALVGEV
jgi:hypothetical protein